MSSHPMPKPNLSKNSGKEHVSNCNWAKEQSRNDWILSQSSSLHHMKRGRKLRTQKEQPFKTTKKKEKKKRGQATLIIIINQLSKGFLFLKKEKAESIREIMRKNS